MNRFGDVDKWPEGGPEKQIVTFLGFTNNFVLSYFCVVFPTLKL